MTVSISEIVRQCLSLNDHTNLLQLVNSLEPTRRAIVIQVLEDRAKQGDIQLYASKVEKDENKPSARAVFFRATVKNEEEEWLKSLKDMEKHDDMVRKSARFVPQALPDPLIKERAQYLETSSMLEFAWTGVDNVWAYSEAYVQNASDLKDEIDSSVKYYRGPATTPAKEHYNVYDASYSAWVFGPENVDMEPSAKEIMDNRSKKRLIKELDRTLTALAHMNTRLPEYKENQAKAKDLRNRINSFGKTVPQHIQALLEDKGEEPVHPLCVSMLSMLQHKSR